MGAAPTREARMEMLLKYDKTIERHERELAQAVKDKAPAQNLTVRRNFIKTLREHRGCVWNCAVNEGITGREYSEWRARLTMAGR